MQPVLRYEFTEVPSSPLKSSPLPALVGDKMLQNDLIFDLSEDDELFEGYGTLATSYPYPQQDHYTRKLENTKFKTIVLENDFIKAVFLPERGGRLWSLEDKTSGKNLLYTNDVIRYSNLAICNAWFSGGVEWNIGMIGHTPFTTKPLYCAELTAEEGWPILRMYEYERVRGVHWQMDFWLRPDSRALNCRMRITNDSTEVLPMYWWSNIAVPEFENGQIFTPADAAYMYTLHEDGRGKISRTGIPIVDGKNICQYQNIEKQIDYFFDLQKDAPRYIANVDESGFGLLQLSTDRLKSRKLFSWGFNEGSDNWQEFLTEKAGRYLEIQAGLPKTQYGCIPMPPHTAWEWMEQYGPIQLDTSRSWHEMQQQATRIAQNQIDTEQLEQTLAKTKAMAKTPAKRTQDGSQYSSFCRLLRPQDGNRALAAHLDFGSCDDSLKDWISFMKTGILHCPDPKMPPDALFCEFEVRQKLIENIERNKQNWYAHYQLGVMLTDQGDYETAKTHLKLSLELEENPWSAHALASLYLLLQKPAKSAVFMKRGCLMRTDDLCYQKEGLRLLLLVHAYQDILQILDHLPHEIRNDSRIRFDEAQALAAVGEVQQAFTLLSTDGGLVPHDIRESDGRLEKLWINLQNQLGTHLEVPHKMRFQPL